MAKHIIGCGLAKEDVVSQAVLGVVILARAWLENIHVYPGMGQHLLQAGKGLAGYLLRKTGTNDSGVWECTDLILFI